MRILLLLLLFVPVMMQAQSKKQRKALEAQQKADQLIISNIKNHIQYLSGNKKPDSSKSGHELKDYIVSQFQQAGLQPKGTSGFLQPFLIDDGRQISSETFLKVNDTLLTLSQDYFPLSFSANKMVAGTPAMSLREKGVPWFADLKEWLDENISNPQHDLNEVIQKEALRAASKGATALFVYNTGNYPDTLRFNSKNNFTPSVIPVIYISPKGYKKHFTDHANILDIELNVSIKERTIEAGNIAGFIDNGAATTIVIGAGYGNEPTEQNENAEGKQLNESVADNASGAAILIELAKMLGSSKARHNNYLFVAFNGENFSRAGSKYWISHPAIATPVNYVITLNKAVSNDSGSKISVSGYSTSPDWPQVLAAINDKNLNVSLDSTLNDNVGLSEFYRKKIPVLNFYVPGRSGSKVYNYQPDLQITRLVQKLVEATDAKSKLAFAEAGNSMAPTTKFPATKSIAEATVENSMPNNYLSASKTAAAKASVSLGIITDNRNYMEGLRINHVSPHKLAAAIGLQPGDILRNVGSYKIADMKTYLQALSNFKPGDKTVLLIKRGKEDKEFAVEF